MFRSLCLHLCRPLALLGMAALLGGCVTQMQPVDKSYTSQNQDSRVMFLVLHYTVGNFEDSLKTLTQPSNRPVSSHYLVRDDPVKVYQLVDESQRAWHAGVSYWRGSSNLNASSIGIEIVNPGRIQTPTGEQYVPFPQAQIDAVIALCKDIVARHQIRPERIVGHSDIQAQSKQDPGPMFPWKQLADAGLIGWPNASMVQQREALYSMGVPPIDWFQGKLADFGYDVPRNGALDTKTRNVIAAFQMKYRPSKYDGEPDAQTAALLDVVTQADGLVMSQPDTMTKPYTSAW